VSQTAVQSSRTLTRGEGSPYSAVAARPPSRDDWVEPRLAALASAHLSQPRVATRASPALDSAPPLDPPERVELPPVHLASPHSTLTNLGTSRTLGQRSHTMEQYSSYAHHTTGHALTHSAPHGAAAFAPSSSSRLGTTALPPSLSAKPRIPAFAPAASSQSSPAAHALALPPPSVLAAFPPAPSPYTASTTSASPSLAPPPSLSDSGALPTTSRRIPAFGAPAPSTAGPSSSSSATGRAPGLPPPQQRSGPLPSFGNLLSPAHDLSHLPTPPALAAAAPKVVPRRRSSAEEDDSYAAEALSSLCHAQHDPPPFSLSPSPPPPPADEMSPAPPPPPQSRHSQHGGAARPRLASNASDETLQGAAPSAVSPPESSASPSGGTFGDVGEGDGNGTDEGGRGSGGAKKELKQTSASPLSSSSST